jgi:hypothetical protein
MAKIKNSVQAQIYRFVIIDISVNLFVGCKGPIIISAGHTLTTAKSFAVFAVLLHIIACHTLTTAKSFAVFTVLLHIHPAKTQ